MGFRAKVADRMQSFVGAQHQYEQDVTGKNLIGEGLKAGAHVIYGLSTATSARTPSPTSAPRSGGLPGQYGLRDKIAGMTERAYQAEKDFQKDHGRDLAGVVTTGLLHATHFVATMGKAPPPAEPGAAAPERVGRRAKMAAATDAFLAKPKNPDDGLGKSLFKATARFAAREVNHFAKTALKPRTQLAQSPAQLAAGSKPEPLRTSADDLFRSDSLR